MMKKLLCTVLAAAMLLSFVPASPAAASGQSAEEAAELRSLSGTTAAGAGFETVGIGGGGAFFTPLINPTDPDNYLVTCDMGGLYWSLDAGRSWNRTESRFWLREATVAQDGTVFCGAYGLYASFDKGATLERIYPKTIKFAVSRCGWPEELFLADGYNNGYIKCIAPFGGRVYFLTLDWYGELRLVSCDYDGNNVTEYFTAQTDIDNPVSGVTCKMLAQDGFLLYTFGNTLIRYDLTDRTQETVYTAEGTLNDLEKIGENYFLLDQAGNRTAILYGSDLTNWNDLSDLNTLSPDYTKWDGTHSVDWLFNDISGTDFDHIFVCFNSDNGDGVLFFDGTEFHWVLDKYHKDRSYYGIEGWSYNCYGPFYGVAVDPNDGSRCLTSTIETVYALDFDSEENCTGNSLHCTKTPEGSYTTTGLDVQTTYDVYQDPFDSEHLIICTTDMGLQISDDGGSSWHRNEITDHWELQNTCYDLYFDPHTEGKVYALWSNRHDAPYECSTGDKWWTEGAFAVSNDGGMTWDFDNYSTGLPDDSIPVKMSVRENGQELMIAVACFNYGFYISYDSGRTFISISDEMTDCDGFIWGEDVLIAEDTVYCLTAWYQGGGTTSAKLYTYDLLTGDTDFIDLGRIVIPRSLTWDDGTGLYLNVVPYFQYEWRTEWQDGIHVNYGGGVYHLESGEFVRIFEDDYGVFNSAFAPDGTLYIASLTGAVYALKDGQSSVFADGLFPNLKYISILGDTMYVTSFGGGTYRMPLPAPAPEYDGDTGASIYCWDTYLLNEHSYPAWRDFLQSLNISRVYQSLEPAYFATGWVNEAVSRLHADGIETVLLTGDRSWGLEDCDLSEYKALIDTAAAYNAAAEEDEKITAVALDVETYTYSAWKSNKTAYFEVYAEKMLEAYTYAHQNGLRVIQVIPTHFDTISGIDFAGFVARCSDELSLMNYYKEYQESAIAEEVAISRALGRRVESIFETMPYSEHYSVDESNTYFYEGYDALCGKWDLIEQRYAYDGLVPSYHHLPTVYHTVTGNNLAEIYVYSDRADPSRDELGQPTRLSRLVLTGDNGDVITAGIYNPNLTAEYPETCFLAVGVKPGVTYTVTDPDGRYVASSTKTFTFDEESDPVMDYTSLRVTYLSEPLKIESASLILNGKLDLAYTAQIPAAFTDPQMIFTGPSGTETVTDYTLVNGKYVFTYRGINPQCMADNVSATLIATRNGTQECVSVSGYSVRQYCANKLADANTSAALRTLLSDLLTFGAAAQTYSGYKTDDLVTDGLTLSPSSFAAIPERTVSFTGTADPDTEWVGAGLVLSDSTAIRFTFFTEDAEDITVKVRLGGREETFTAEDFTQVGANTYSIDFCGICADEFDAAVSAGFCRNGAQIGRTANYCVNTYLYNMQDCENADLQALVRVLYNYGVSAAAYIAE